MAKRALSKIRQALKAPDLPEPVMDLSCPAAERNFQTLWHDIPIDLWRTVTVNALVCQCAEIQSQLETINKRLADGSSEKEHQDLAAVSSLSGRLAGILSRLKLTPSQDKREIQRAARSDAKYREVGMQNHPLLAGYEDEAEKLLA